MTTNAVSLSPTTERLALGLGWFSLGLGLAEMLAPRQITKLAGISESTEHSDLVRLMGLREVVSGIGILSQPHSSAWLWARVGGDAIDLGLLGAAFKADPSNRGRLAAAAAAVAGVTAADVFCAQQLRRSGLPAEHSLHIKKSITINSSPEELYRFWHQFENLPRFMDHLESVKRIDDRRWRWVAKGPGGTNVTWDAEVVEDRLNERIAWRSLPGADVPNAGVVRFERAPGGRGTIVRVEMDYTPPAGVLGSTVAKLTGQTPQKQVPVDLLHFKQLIETGEVARTEGQPAGRARSTSRKYDEPVRV